MLSKLIFPSTATSASANEDADPQQASQLLNPANPDLPESQKIRAAKNNEGGGSASQGDSAQQPASNQMFQVTIGTKSLLKFLSTNVSNSGTIACKLAVTARFTAADPSTTDV
jgi:hypothetical protein